MPILSKPEFVSGYASGLMKRALFNQVAEGFKLHYVRSSGNDRGTYPETDPKTGKTVFMKHLYLRSVIAVEKDKSKSRIFFDSPFNKKPMVPFVIYAREPAVLKAELERLKTLSSVDNYGSYDLVIIKKTRLRFMAAAQQAIDLDKTFLALRSSQRFSFVDKSASEKRPLNTKRVDAVYNHWITKMSYQIYPYQVFLNVRLSDKETSVFPMHFEKWFNFIEQYIVSLSSVY